MAHYKKRFPSDYLKECDLDGEELQVTIAGIADEWIGQGRDATEKAVLTFNEVKQKLVLNVTNANAIAKAYGEDDDDWIGKRIVLFPTTTEMKGEMVPCIRVKVPQAKETVVVPVDDDGNELDKLHDLF